MSETTKQLRTQSSINRAEWIKWSWKDVTAVGDTERMYLQDIERPISEAKEAAENFDLYWRAGLAVRQLAEKNA